MRIVWPRRALPNPYHVREYIRRDDPAVAAKVDARIEAMVKGLIRFPESGRIGEVAGPRELILLGLPYVIVYRLGSDRGKSFVSCTEGGNGRRLRSGG